MPVRTNTGVLPLFALVALGCGGTDPSPVPPPPPPPPPAPAAIAIQAGNDQTGAPGAPLAVEPVLVVRDNRNQPVNGATVTFAVTAGGGSVQRQAATTAPDGTASPGQWTLGPAEGDQSLGATVAGLTPVTLVARARVPAVRLADTTLPASGGTIRVQKAGDPLDGLTLRIPAGAFPTAGRWTIGHRPLSTVPAVTGLKPVGVVLEIETDLGLADSMLLLTIPFAPAGDSIGLPMLRDPTSGAIEPLPIVSRTATSVTVASRHLSPAQMLSAAVPNRGPARSPAIAGTTATVVLNYYSQTALASGQQVTSAFRVSNDDWEFGNHGSYLTPVGHTTGLSASAVFYFLKIKTGALGLFGRFDQGPVWADNALGYRVAALAETDIDWPAVRAALASAPTIAGLTPDATQLLATAGAFQSLGSPPVLLALEGTLGPIVLVAVAVSQAGIEVADPTNPGHTALIPFAAGRFQPLRLAPFVGANPIPYTKPRMIGLSAVVPVSRLGARFAELTAGQVGVRDFPPYAIEYFDEDFGVWTAAPTGPLRVSWQTVGLRVLCPSCDKPLNTPGTANQTGFDVYDHAGVRLGQDRGVGRVDVRVANGNNRVGLHVLGQCQACGTNWRHVDFRYLQIETSKYYLTPDPARVGVNAPLTLTARNLATTPAGLRYNWSFGDGGTAQFDGDSTVTHQWQSAGTYQVNLVVTQASIVVGKARVTVEVGQPAPIWRLTTWRPTRITPSQGVIPKDFRDEDARRNDAKVYLELQGNAAQYGVLFYLDQPQTTGGTTYRTGVHLQRSLTLPPATGLDPTLFSRAMALAPQPGGSFPDALTVTGSLSSGTMTGRTHYFLPSSYNVASPWITWELSGTKNGTGLAGTVIRTHNMIECTGGFAPPPGGGPPVCQGYSFFASEVREFAFTATRIQ